MKNSYCSFLQHNPVTNKIQRRRLGDFRVLLFASMLLPWTAFAEEPLKEPSKDKYNGNVEVGFINTGGNTQAQTLNAKAKVVAEYDPWQQTLQLQALSSSDKKTTTAERYLAKLKTDYRFSKRSYAFGLLSYDNDRFSGYDYRASFTVGYGNRVIDEKQLLLELEGGPGFRSSKVTRDGTQDEAILRLAGKLGWQVSASSKLEQNLSTEIGNDTTISQSSTSLSTQVVGNLAMKISYSVQYATPVPQGVKKQDTETSVTLVYNF